ncbi:MAG: hypothetical protein Q8K66_10125 [Sediminibacterium sp.]|nr:hypothetical protein [Sediminibacterium sp.]
MKVPSVNSTNLFIALSLLISTVSIGQNVIYRGEKSYPATESWGFTFNGEREANNNDYLSICVAKISHTAGLLSVSITGFFFEQSIITGPVMLYLNNGKAISVLNRVSHDDLDGTITSLFSLNALQLNQLSQHDISRIRFSLNGGGDNFSADNITTSEYVDPYGLRSTITSTYPTASKITELFKN